jgi:galactosyl transferase GMA12/MNN10 family
MIVASIATEEFRDFRELTFPNKKAYCDRHGYSFVSAKSAIHRARPASWSKIKLLEMIAFEREKEWVFWTDADAAITRLDWKVEELADPNVDLIISKDNDGINAGSFLMQLNGKSRQFLLNAYDRIRFMHHRRREAVAMETLLQDGYPLQVKHVEKKLINAYPEDYQEGFSAVLHVPHKPWPERLAELKKRMPAI